MRPPTFRTTWLTSTKSSCTSTCPRTTCATHSNRVALAAAIQKQARVVTALLHQTASEPPVELPVLSRPNTPKVAVPRVSNEIRPVRSSTRCTLATRSNSSPTLVVALNINPLPQNQPATNNRTILPTPRLCLVCRPRFKFPSWVPLNLGRVTAHGTKDRPTVWLQA